MADPPTLDADAPSTFTVHLLDVGRQEYGDCILCQFGQKRVLIDGAHPRDDKGVNSIPKQLAKLLGPPPHRIDLLIVTHAHSDHVGCLPALIDRGLLDVRVAFLADPDLGFGRDRENPHDFAGLTPEARRVVAALREESRSFLSDAEVEEFLADAEDVEPDYDRMIEKLGDKVVRFQGVETQAVRDLEQRFKSIGLKVLAPTQEQLLVCADRIYRSMNDAIVAARGSDLAADATVEDQVALYRALADRTAGPTDSEGLAADDGSGRDGAAVNNQSMVLRFGTGARKVLFTGDMQFVKPGVGGLKMPNLRAAVRADGPFAFAKVSHHGSANAFDQKELDAYGAPWLGICTGVDSNQHPSGKVLDVLRANAQDVEWARTDRNGLVTFTISPDGVTAKTARRDTSDDADPTEDAARRAAAAASAIVEAQRGAEAAGKSGGATVVAGAGESVVELTARIRVRVSVELDAPQQDPAPAPGARRPGAKPAVPARPVRERPLPRQREGAGTLRRLNVAQGRPVQNLLFVTSGQGLAENLGPEAAAHALRALRDAGANVFDGLPYHVRDATAAAPLVRAELARHKPAGVVLLGGYDVIPPQRLDVLTPDLRADVDAEPFGRDLDDFLVWNDEVYGSFDGEGLADVPVSRIPDGRSHELVFAALEAAGSNGGGDVPTDGVALRCGVRNVNRPFADEVYQELGGDSAMLASEPTAHDVEPPLDLRAIRLYLMLHGKAEDGTWFWGERAGPPQNWPQTIGLRNVPAGSVDVVLCGACWGALCANTIALDAASGADLGARTADQSIAMKFLRGGVRAFVGCTGSHYSPRGPAASGGGGPMHLAFWAEHQAGHPPAQALFNARRTYLADMPRKRNQAKSKAVEFKTLYQFVCLGLGW